MDESLFIVAAYGLTGILLGWLCMATWLRAARVKKQLRGATNILDTHSNPSLAKKREAMESEKMSVQ